MFPIRDSIPSLRFPIINIGLIVFTCYVFYLQITAANPDAFIAKYALVPSSVNFGDINTLLPFVTAIFLHGGFLHILSNMVFLWVFGDNVEGYLPFFVYPLLYLFSGIIGNIVQYLISPVSSIPMLGASGAIAGVLGAYFILFPHAKIKTIIFLFVFVTIIDVSAGFMLGYWFVLQILSGAASLPFTGTAGGVAFFAHVGGFATGVAAALFFKKNIGTYHNTPVIEGKIVE